MDKYKFHKSIVIHNSHIEFLVVGPKGNNNGVLVKSEKLKIDLIGFAAGSSDIDDYDKYSFSIIDLLLFISRTKMYFVESNSARLINYNNDVDNRKTKYKFYWVGMCRSSDKKKIREIFNRCIEDLLIGIETEDIERIEWSIAPVIYHCAKAQKQLKKRRKNLAFFSVTYLLIILITAILYWSDYI